MFRMLALLVLCASLASDFVVRGPGNESASAASADILRRQGARGSRDCAILPSWDFGEAKDPSAGVDR